LNGQTFVSSKMNQPTMMSTMAKAMQVRRAMLPTCHALQASAIGPLRTLSLGYRAATGGATGSMPGKRACCAGGGILRRDRLRGAVTRHYSAC
jgi:hypothetical protein